MEEVKDETIMAVSVLFGAYGKVADEERQAIYCSMLSTIPYKLLIAGIERAINTRTFLPSVSDLKEDCRSVAATIDGSLKAKSWQEAWKEIEKAVHNTYWGEKPKFSTPEIAETVSCYGWSNIYMAESRNWQNVHAQLREIYKTICERKKDEKLNRRIAEKYHLADSGMRRQIAEVARALDFTREVDE